MKKIIYSILVFCLFISCVTQTEYDKLQLENKKLQSEINELKNGARDRLDKIINAFDKKEYNTVLILADSLNNAHPSSTQNVKGLEYKMKSEKIITENEAKEKKEIEISINERIKTDKEKARKIIRISRYYPSKPNSASGVDFSVEWQNKSKKTIKYITFEVVPYNGVGDIVRCSIRDNSYYTGRVTGPIKSGSWYGNSKSWSNAWYNNTIRKIVLTDIKIEYIDGSTEHLYGDKIKYATY